MGGGGSWAMLLQPPSLLAIDLTPDISDAVCTVAFPGQLLLYWGQVAVQQTISPSGRGSMMTLKLSSECNSVNGTSVFR